MKDKVRKQGKFMVLRMAGVFYSFFREYLLMVNLFIGYIGCFIVLDGLFGKGSFLGEMDKAYEFFHSVDYFQVMIALYLVYYFCLSIFVQRRNRIPSVFAAVFVLMLTVYSVADEKIWYGVIVTCCLFYVFKAIISIFENRANDRGYSILNPESEIKIEIEQVSGYARKTNLRERGE